MNKALMISIQPQHAINILNGKKTLELRTWIPKGYVGWVYVYVTKTIRNYKMSYYYQPNYKSKNQDKIYRLHGNIPLRFWFDEYETYDFDNHGVQLYTDVEEYNVMYDDLERLCLDYREIENYGKGKTLYAWHIKQLEVFDEPKQLSEFYKRMDGLDENGGFILGNLKDGEFVTIPELRKKYLLSKAPQRSVWVYVEDKE